MKPKKPSTDLSIDDFLEKLREETPDIGSFRDRLLPLVFDGRTEEMRSLCREEYIMTPIFMSHLIEEITEGDSQNDLRFLVARTLLDAIPSLVCEYAPLLHEKRRFVPNPDADVRTFGARVIRARHGAPPRVEEGLAVPSSILRLLVGDLSWADPQDPQSFDRTVGEHLVLGPGFFAQYIEGTELARLGTRAMFSVTMGIPPERLTLEGRVFQAAQRLLPFAVDQFQALLAPYRAGRLRRATPDERELFYALIDFEIEDQPVHVVECEEGRLLLYAQPDERLRWIEYLDRWGRGVSSSTLDALKKGLGDL